MVQYYKCHEMDLDTKLLINFQYHYLNRKFTQMRTSSINVSSVVCGQKGRKSPFEEPPHIFRLVFLECCICVCPSSWGVLIPQI